MELLLKPEQLAYPQGLCISVEGFKGDIGSKIASQVFIEVYKGKLRVHVWKGDEDPACSVDIDRSQPRSARKRKVPLCHHAK